MKNKLKLLSLLALCFFVLFSCKKKEVMPDYSTTGTNTFGAYVNGKLWLPKGRPTFFEPNLDIAFGNESLSISAAREVSKEPLVYERIIFDMTKIDHEGVYLWDNNPEVGLPCFKSGSCYYYWEPDVYRKGWLEITKLDLKNGIIAGKFEFTVAMPGCDTIRVTGGRFDKKMF